MKRRRKTSESNDETSSGEKCNNKTRGHESLGHEYARLLIGCGPEKNIGTASTGPVIVDRVDKGIAYEAKSEKDLQTRKGKERATKQALTMILNPEIAALKSRFLICDESKKCREVDPLTLLLELERDHKKNQ
ncbi:MAG: hypothetical protein ACFFD4_26375 [Candidatus Odinarchaeota archaeon]